MEFVVVLDLMEDGLFGLQQPQDLFTLRLPAHRVHQFVLGLVGDVLEQPIDIYMLYG